MLVKREKPLHLQGTFKIPTDKGVFFTVDLDDFLTHSRYRWRAKKKKGNWYAYRRYTRNGKTHEIAMHRIIAKSQKWEEPHHENHITTDNRKINLKNVPHNQHPHF